MLKKDLEQELNRTKLILDYAREELKLKDNIIKEVREYTKENMSYIEKGELKYIPSGEDILEILDKVGDEK